ncbi:MAG: Uma2 family endonuclease [Chloroflexi bacterium]|nr:Uma2 family endonuclease [Chloroflexota bacterium]
MTIQTDYVEIKRYYDTHEVEDEEVGQNWEHLNAIDYLYAVLKWMYHDQRRAIGSSINLYQTSIDGERPKSPDLMVLEDLVVEELSKGRKSSYYVGLYGPPPPVVFEISSEATWQKDLEEKPAQYASMGVVEYFAFDPSLPGIWTGGWREYGRLVGWRRPLASKHSQEITKDEFGRLWSEQLQSWLVVEGKFLRLYTADGQLRLTETEAERQRANAEWQRAEAERQRANAAEKLVEAEKQQTEAEWQRANAAEKLVEAEKQQTEVERQRAEKLAEILRRHNLDPDNLL